jgi:hypothetical protein
VYRAQQMPSVYPPGRTASLFPSNKRTSQANIFGFDAASRAMRPKDFPLLFSNVAGSNAQFFG